MKIILYSTNVVWCYTWINTCLFCELIEVLISVHVGIMCVYNINGFKDVFEWKEVLCFVLGQNSFLNTQLSMKEYCWLKKISLFIYKYKCVYNYTHMYVCVILYISKEDELGRIQFGNI